ncbi:MAG TPA: vitamin K epoxide reductase family protein [Acidimicrobiales bacterium]|nr:vitamin K epoxide reductase family protein [Acidimicrobiales bacterium]
MIRAVGPVPRWAKVATLLLSLAGLGVSIYLTITHFQPQLLICSSTGTVDCAAVTTSAQSYFLGVPVAVLGLAQYAVMTALTTPWAWQSKRYELHVARFALSVVAMAFVLWLLAAELLIIDHICLWCTGVHVITFALLVVLTRVTPTQLGWTFSDSSTRDALAR